MANACCKYLTVSLVPAAALFLAVLFGVGTLTLPILYSELAKKYEYGVVIDAGSSHTTLYVYKVEVPLNGNIGQIHFIKQDNSLDSYAASPPQVAPMIQKLINDSFNKSLPGDLRVPDNLINTTHLYLGATAGMRLLNIRNDTASASHEILQYVNKTLKSSVPHYVIEEGARIIDGKEEAAGGWATVNYLGNTLDTGEVGSLDMGGASTEIAFKATPESASEPFYTKEVLFDKAHSIYARSYLCYGHVEAWARFLGHLVHKHNSSGSLSAKDAIPNPCFNDKYSVHISYSTFNTSCVVDPIAEEVFGHALKLPSGYSASDNMTFTGTGNFTQCLSEISTAFAFNACKPGLNCAQETAAFKVPPSNGSFIAFTGFHYVASLFHIDNKIYNNSGESFSSTFEKKCTPVLTGPKNGTDMCFYGIFMAYLMEEGFGMTSTSKYQWQVKFKSKLSSSAFGWSLGYLMNRTTSKHYKVGYGYHDARPFTTVDLVVGMVILTLLCAIFVIFFFLTFYACKKALESPNGYQSIS